MAWETRGSGRYYYRKRKVGGRVITEYVGRGPEAALEASVDVAVQEERKATRQRLQEELEAQDAIDAEIDRLGRLGQELLAAALVASGYHRHKREWRLERGRKHTD